MPFSFIPNLITLMNLAAGSLAVVYAVDGNPGWAAICIFIAAVFDFLDGFAARMLKAYSNIGKELDSLADVVSFGLAPGMIMFSLMKIALFGENIPLHAIQGGPADWLFLSAALLIPLFSAYRLAKFNVDTRQTINFLGLPTPANAILWGAFGLMTAFSGNEDLLKALFTPGNLSVTALITSLLLISEIPMFSLKFTGLDFRQNWFRYIFLAASAGLILVNWVMAPALIIFLYIFLSVFFYLLKVEY
jgi:CDP-diacylglycerol---serine O-phosphatidyltransferase